MPRKAPITTYYLHNYTTATLLNELRQQSIYFTSFTEKLLKLVDYSPAPPQYVYAVKPDKFGIQVPCAAVEVLQKIALRTYWPLHPRAVYYAALDVTLRSLFIQTENDSVVLGTSPIYYADSMWLFKLKAPSRDNKNYVLMIDVINAEELNIQPAQWVLVRRR